MRRPDTPLKSGFTEVTQLIEHYDQLQDDEIAHFDADGNMVAINSAGWIAKLEE